MGGLRETPRMPLWTRIALASVLRADHGKDEAQALQRVCLVLINANEFVYLD